MVLVPLVLCYFRLRYFSIPVLRLCSVILVFSGLPVSPIYFFPHSHGMLYMQLFVSWVPFLCLLSVSMVRSVVRDLNAVGFPNLFPDSGIFFRYSPDVRYYHSTFHGFLISRVLFLALAENFINQFWWVSIFC
jgi:hypothetical protein